MKEIILNEYKKRWIIDLNLIHNDKEYKEDSYNALLRAIVETKETDNNILAYITILLIDDIGEISISDIYPYKTNTKDNLMLLEEIKEILTSYVNDNFKDFLELRGDYEFIKNGLFKVYELKEIKE